MSYKDLDKRRANQRAWVRQKRIDRRIDKAGQGIDKVKPKPSIPVRPKPELATRAPGLSESQWNYIQFKAEQEAK